MKNLTVNYDKATEAEKRILSAIQDDETLFQGKADESKQFKVTVESVWTGKKHSYLDNIKASYFSNSQGHFKVYCWREKIFEAWQLDADEWEEACKKNASCMWL